MSICCRLHLLLIICLVISCGGEKPELTIGLIADPQYADQESRGKRHYRESLWKLQEAIDTFNLRQVDFVQTLGDVIDKNWASFDSILPIYANLDPKIDHYHLLGNHDFSYDSVHFTHLVERLNMPDRYYSYTLNNWRFIVLDATDYAYFSEPLHHHGKVKIDSLFEQTVTEVNRQDWNGAMGKKQQFWLEQQLDSATLLDQKVIVFSHLPLKPEGDPHNLWNNYEIIDIIERSSNVVAFINGHNHAGNYVHSKGIHYVTLFGMVDTLISSFGILEIYKDRMVLKGYGNQKTLQLSI